MKIAERIHLVASGQLGFHLTDDYDCHVYLLDGGDEYALIDAGGGRDPDAIVRLVSGDGLDVGRVRSLFLTHAHADHAAGAAGLRQRLGLRVLASPAVAQVVADGDARAASLEAAKQAGGYPPDFAYPACRVEETLADGAVVKVGDLEVQAIATPGHAAGHLSYVVRWDGRTSVFCDDAFFCGDRILLQHTWDCSLSDSIRTVERLDSLSVDGLFPGHLTFAVRHGRRHVEQAMEYVRKLLPPPQLA